MDTQLRKKIISEYLSGKGSTTIEKELSISKPIILKILKEEGITRKRDRCKSLNIEKEGNQYVLYWKCKKCEESIKRISYSSTLLCRNHYRQTKDSGICKKCSLELQVGKGNPFYGKKHSKKTLKLMSKNMSKNCLKSGPKSKKENKLLDIIKNVNKTTIGSYSVENFICDIFIQNKNLIIEFNGDYWHCNPNKFKPNYFHKHKNKTAQEIWKDDSLRIENIKKKGYNLFVIWESDMENPEYIKNFIEAYVKN
jgi:hypothetical protein